MPSPAAAQHARIRAAGLEYGEPVSDAVSGQVLVFRGIPAWAEPRIRPGDLVTTDPDSAWAYAMRRGRLLSAEIDARELVYYQKASPTELELQYTGSAPAGHAIDPARAPTLGDAATRTRFERHVEKMRAQRYIRYVYAKERVPADAVAVCLYIAPSDRSSETWYYVTPGFRYDPGEWRVSVWDASGPIGHYTDDVSGRAFRSLHDAVAHVLWEHREARIVEYVAADGEHVRVGPGVPCR
jgi:hypothetical protein